MSKPYCIANGLEVGIRQRLSEYSGRSKVLTYRLLAFAVRKEHQNRQATRSPAPPGSLGLVGTVTRHKAEGDRLHDPLRTVRDGYCGSTIFIVVPPTEIDSSFEAFVETAV